MGWCFFFFLEHLDFGEKVLPLRLLAVREFPQLWLALIRPWLDRDTVAASIFAFLMTHEL